VVAAVPASPPCCQSVPAFDGWPVRAATRLSCFMLIGLAGSVSVSCVTSDSRTNPASSSAGGHQLEPRARSAPAQPSAAPSTGAVPSGNTVRAALPALAPAEPLPTLLPVAPEGLVVTSGSIVVSELPPPSTEPLSDAGAREQRASGWGRFTIQAPTFRAWLGKAPRAAIELDFVYQGPSTLEAPLASGELRRQIGVELRAQDACNLVYVMWHIEPKQLIQVSVKANPGQTHSAQCGDHGYSILQPLKSRPMPRVAIGQRHTLEAVLDGARLQVLADGVTSWIGQLPPAAQAFDGPVGVRSDNGDFQVQLRASSPAG
jgi:hypothetical protein